MLRKSVYLKKYNMLLKEVSGKKVKLYKMDTFKYRRWWEHGWYQAYYNIVTYESS